MTAENSVECRRSYLVLLTTFLCQCLYGIGLFNPTVYYVIYVEIFNISNQTGAWLTAIYAASCFFIGIVASPCVVHYGCHRTAAVGGLLFSTSLAISSQLTNIFAIFLFQSALAGFGAGALFISANVILNQYFDRRRPQAASFALTGMGVGMLVAPLLSTYLVEEFGWRGSLLIQAALMAHSVPLGLTFTPLKINKSPKKPFSALLTSVFDFSLLEDRAFLVYCISSLLIRMNSTAIITHLPRFLVSKGFSLHKAAFIASVSGATNITARFSAVLMTSFQSFDAPLVFGVFMVLNAVSTIMFILLEGVIGMSIAAAVFGFSFGFDYPFVPIILVKLKGPEKLPVAMGIYNLVSMATVIVTIPPITGLLYDMTGSYTLPLSSTVFMSLVGSTVIMAASVKMRKDTPASNC